MRIGIIGSGNVGGGIGKRLAAHGHTVMFSFAKEQAKLEALAGEIGPQAKTGTPAAAAAFGEVVVLATPWGATAEALQATAPLTGKILWDCTNPLKPDMSGLAIGTTNSGGEEVARLAPQARVVKAIPPFAEMLHGPALPAGSSLPAVFLCGDDGDAKHVVAELVRAIGGEPIDAGPLSAARYTEPLGMLLVQLAYKQALGSRIGASLLRFS